MKKFRNLILAKLLLVTWFSAFQIPTLTNAQSTALQGKFRLLDDVYWGKAVLPAGEYSFTLDSTVPNTIYAIIRSTDGKKAAFAMATNIAVPTAGGSYISITNDGTRRVRLLNLPQLNLLLTFGPPTKGTREVLYAIRTQTVPVAVAEK